MPNSKYIICIHTYTHTHMDGTVCISCIRLLVFLSVDGLTEKEITLLLNTRSVKSQMSFCWQPRRIMMPSTPKTWITFFSRKEHESRWVGEFSATRQHMAEESSRCAVIGEPAGQATDTHFDKSHSHTCARLPAGRIPAGTESCVTCFWLASPLLSISWAPYLSLSPLYSLSTRTRRKKKS